MSSLLEVALFPIVFLALIAYNLLRMAKAQDVIQKIGAMAAEDSEDITDIVASSINKAVNKNR